MRSASWAASSDCRVRSSIASRSRARAWRCRIVGEVTRDRVELLRRADLVVMEEFASSGIGRNLWQAFAVLLPLKTVGVMGDGRSYESVIAIRAVESQDGMTADWARLDPGFSRARVEPYHQRNSRRQSRRVRHHLETARHD